MPLHLCPLVNCTPASGGPSSEWSLNFFHKQILTQSFWASGFLRRQRWFFATVGWLGGFLRRSVLGFFCDSAGGVFCDSGRVCGYGKEGYLHQWGFSATVTGVYYIGTGPQRGGASRRLIFVGDCDKQEAAIHCWAPLLDAIAGCHCWAGCHHACHCWVPLLGCHGWGAMAGC